jgi:hypothetical protein
MRRGYHCRPTSPCCVLHSNSIPYLVLYIQNVLGVSLKQLGKRNFTEVTNIACDYCVPCPRSFVSTHQCFSSGSTRSISSTWSYLVICQFRRVPNSAKSLASSCPSRPYVLVEQRGSHWTGFREIWYLGIFFRKTVDKIQVSLKSALREGQYAFLSYLVQLL